MMAAVESQTVPVPMCGMIPAEQHESRQLAYILAQTLTGSSLQLVMNAEAYNGMKSWRLIVQRERPTAGTAQVRQLTSLLQPRFSGRLDTFESALQIFEGLVQA